VTQSVAAMQSDEIDRLLPALVDQYQDVNVFGGGIWPLPEKREAGRNKFSSFFARNASNQLEVNTYWNSDAAPNYYEQVWYKTRPPATAPGRTPTRMTPARSRAPTARW